MNNKEKIILKYNQFLIDFPEKRQLYQLKSLHNFLLHFDEIENDFDSHEILKLINEYLDYINYHNIETKEECKELYFKFIHPIGVLYSKYAGFNILFRYQSILIAVALINLIILFLKINIFLMILINLIGTGLVIYFINKSKTTRVFGINW